MELFWGLQVNYCGSGCLLHSKRRDPFQYCNTVGALRLLTQLMIYYTVSVSALSQGIAGPTLRSGVNYLYFSSVLISIRLLWKPYLTSFSDLYYCSQALVKVNKNIRLLSVLLLATSCQQSTNSLAESFGNLTWLFMQSIARLVCIHNCLILWPLL